MQMLLYHSCCLPVTYCLLPSTIAAKGANAGMQFVGVYSVYTLDNQYHGFRNNVSLSVLHNF